MKGVLFGGALVLALLGAGLAWALRRQPGSADLLETAGDGFTSLPSGSGRLLKLQDALFPLRVLRWLPPGTSAALNTGRAVLGTQGWFW